MVPNELHVTGLPVLNGREFSLIIPNASTQGPPTSSAVQVNPGDSGTDHHRIPPPTELEARLHLALQVSCGIAMVEAIDFVRTALGRKRPTERLYLKIS